MKTNESLADLPVEVVYKYLLRDYRALQQELKEAKVDVGRLLDMRFDEIDIEDEAEIIRLTDKYKQWSKTRYRNEIERLLRMLEKPQNKPFSTANSTAAFHDTSKTL